MLLRTDHLRDITRQIDSVVQLVLPGGAAAAEAAHPGNGNSQLTFFSFVIGKAVERSFFIVYTDFKFF